jgi:hypothetical protein
MNFSYQSSESMQGFFASFWDQIITILPNLLGALLLIIVGWGLAKGVSYLTRRLLQSVNFDRVGQRMLQQTSLKIEKDRIKLSDWVGTFVFWIILLIFLISGADTLEWTAVSEPISALTTYLPQLFSALVVFLIGLYIASVVRKFISATFDALEVSGGRIVSEVVFYIVLIIISTTALEQAGIDTSIITANMSIIIGGILLAFAIGFGYSSRDLLTNILASFYARNIFSEGQTIRIDNTVGMITRIDNIQTILTTQKGELIIPNRRLISENIERLDGHQPTSNESEKSGKVPA